MTDIVERLRGLQVDMTARLLYEAADEIEQLRAACELFTEGAHDAVKALNAAGIAQAMTNPRNTPNDDFDRSE